MAWWGMTKVIFLVGILFMRLLQCVRNDVNKNQVATSSSKCVILQHETD